MKKFAKVLIATAVIGAGAAAVAYFLSRKKKAAIIIDDEFDDIDDDDDDDRTYVSLNQPEEKEDTFTPLKETVAEAVEKVDEKVEDFFDEDDEN